MTCGSNDGFLSWGKMTNEELEKVLERVAELVDKKKAFLIGFADPDEGMPTGVLRSYSKGELVAELVYLDFTGRWRKRFSWYERFDEWP